MFHVKHRDLLHRHGSSEASSPATGSTQQNAVARKVGSPVRLLQDTARIDLIVFTPRRLPPGRAAYSVRLRSPPTPDQNQEGKASRETPVMPSISPHIDVKTPVPLGHQRCRTTTLLQASPRWDIPTPYPSKHTVHHQSTESDPRTDTWVASSECFTRNGANLPAPAPQHLSTSSGQHLIVPTP